MNDTPCNNVRVLSHAFIDLFAFLGLCNFDRLACTVLINGILRYLEEYFGNNSPSVIKIEHLNL